MRMERVGHVAGMYGGDEEYTRGFGGAMWRKDTPWRPEPRVNDNTEIGLKNWKDGADWIHLTQNRDKKRALVQAVMNLRVPYNAGNFFSRSKPNRFYRKNLPHVVTRVFKLSYTSKYA
jgi:hypothetical protein